VYYDIFVRIKYRKLFSVIGTAAGNAKNIAEESKRVWQGFSWILDGNRMVQITSVFVLE